MPSCMLPTPPEYSCNRHGWKSGPMFTIKWTGTSSESEVNIKVLGYLPRSTRIPRILPEMLDSNESSQSGN